MADNREEVIHHNTTIIVNYQIPQIYNLIMEMNTIDNATNEITAITALIGVVSEIIENSNNKYSLHMALKILLEELINKDVSIN